ncbi:MAG: general secretion pathway protein GspB [Ramlibacter sp.]
MSYILDALKKADAQRERDPARGIHAQPAPLPTSQQPAIGQRPWVWAAAAAGIAVLAVAGWFLSQQAVEMPRAPVATSEVASPRSSGVPAAAPAPLGTTAAAPSPVGAAAPAPEPVAHAVLPPPAPIMPPVAAAPQGQAVTTPAERAVRPAPAAKAPPAAGATADAKAAATPPVAPEAVAAAPVPAPASTRPAASPVPAAPAGPAATPAAAGDPPAANGWPPDAPKLAISGGVYSANRAQRMLIVNGQVVNEGADLGGGLVLEEIRPKAAVLRFRGGRYNVGF